MKGYYNLLQRVDVFMEKSTIMRKNSNFHADLWVLSSCIKLKACQAKKITYQLDKIIKFLFRRCSSRPRPTRIFFFFVKGRVFIFVLYIFFSNQIMMNVVTTPMIAQWKLPVWTVMDLILVYALVDIVWMEIFAQVCKPFLLKLWTFRQ